MSDHKPSDAHAAGARPPSRRGALRHQAFLASAPDLGRADPADHRASIVVVLGLLGRNHAAVVQILGSSPVAIGMLLFVLVSVYHMWLGMQVIIEDYVHDELPKYAALMSNTFFSCAVGLTAVFAILKLSFGL